MKKKRILNICMVIMIFLVIACGVVAVGSVKGWFDKEDDVFGMMVTEKNGIAMIERNGVAYEVETGTSIRKEDGLYTKTSSSLTIADDKKSRIYLDGEAEIAVRELEEAVQFEVIGGDVFIDARDFKQVKIYCGESEVTMDQAVISISVQTGSSTVTTYSGEANVDGETVSAGSVASIINGNPVEVSELLVTSLSEFQIEKLIVCGIEDSFAVTEKEIEQVKAEREEERLRVQQELLDAEEAEKEAGREKESEASDSNTEDKSSDDVKEDNKKYCTIQIRCSTILKNLENLTSGKEVYVPSNGIILATSELAFDEGETVFDVLQRACRLAGIQLEYSYTPVYGSYYIEGINHLYEFDCGNLSGWTYKVNGWYPNYGCSSYKLKDGDNIVWSYTCDGLSGSN